MEPVPAWLQDGAAAGQGSHGGNASGRMYLRRERATAQKQTAARREE